MESASISTKQADACLACSRPTSPGRGSNPPRVVPRTRVECGPTRHRHTQRAGLANLSVLTSVTSCPGVVRLTEFLPSLRHALSHCVFVDAQNFGDFPISETLHEVQRQTDSAFWRHMKQRILDGDLLVRVWSGLGSRWFLRAPKQDESQQTPTSMIFQRVVGGDAIESSLERKLRVSFEDALIRFEERVLGQVMGASRSPVIRNTCRKIAG